MFGFKDVRSFFLRHRKKIFFVGSFATGVYLTWKYATLWLSDYQSRQMAAAFAAAKRQTHFESNQRTANATVCSMIPVLRSTLMDELNCENLTEQLQHKPTNKVYLWSELKVVSFTRTLVLIYSTSILVLSLKVQLNVIGGYIYLLNERRPNLSQLDKEGMIQQKYLETIQYFLSSGVRDLCSLVRHSVERELMNVSLKKMFTHSSLLDLINKIRAPIEQRLENMKETPFFEFISTTPTSESLATEFDQLTLPRLLEDTREIWKSEDFHVVLQATIDSGFEGLHKHLSKAWSAAISNSATAVVSPTVSGTVLETNAVALAKIIPPLVGVVHVTCSDNMTDYLQKLLTLPCIDDLAHQIYESFCEEALLK
ncbi:peroxisomal biogenesis factor 3-like [Watersipora subatra]|uniref:peroxisomal biogenesis factor 3-like n=1 Tax=Watersipora subatra TaxID=2589382 RepID=UPI00355C511B